MKLVFIASYRRVFYIFIFFVISLNYIQANDNDKIVIDGCISNRDGQIITDVQIYNKKDNNVVYSNNEGFFTISVSKGNVQLYISHLEYSKQVISFLSQVKDTTLFVVLEKKEREVAEIVVTGKNMHSRTHSSQIGYLTMDKEMIKNIPVILGETDVIKALQTQPGVSAGTEGFAGMYVRGGNGDENLYMLDGIPIYQITHLGGLFSTFNPEFIKDIQFYKSSFPAQYGGKISSVLNIQTNDGNKEKYYGSFTIGLTSGNVNLGGPIVKNKTSFQVSLRRSWLELLSIPALAIMNKNEESKKTIGRYSFTDLNIKIDHSINFKNDIFLNFYWGRDYLKIGEENYMIEDDNVFSRDLSKMKWGNFLLSTGMKSVLNDFVLSRIDIAYVKYNSNIGHDITDVVKKVDLYNKSYSNRISENGIEDIVFNLDFLFNPKSKYQLNWGINYTYHMYKPESTMSEIVKDNVELSNMNKSNSITANEIAAYVEANWSPLTSVRVSTGLRLALFNIYNKNDFSLEPRFSFQYLFLPNLSLKFSYSRMTQYAQQLSHSYVNLPTDFWMPVGKNRNALISDQVSAGFFFDLNENYSFSAEGYYKRMSNLIEYKDGYDSFTNSDDWEDKIASSGKGWSYGTEMSVKKNDGCITGWISYGLMWANRRFKEVNNGISYPAKYDNRHKVNIVANYKLKKDIEFNAGWTYITGNRITLSLENYMDPGMSGFPPSLVPTDPNEPVRGVDYYEGRNNFRLPAYHRMDLGVNFYRSNSKGGMNIWNIGIYNVYSKLNPIVFRKKTMSPTDANKQWDAKFQTLSIFPIIPSISYTYKF